MLVLLMAFACTSGPKMGDSTPTDDSADTRDTGDTQAGLDSVPADDTSDSDDVADSGVGDSNTDSASDTGTAPFEAFPAAVALADADAILYGVDGCLAGRSMATGDVDGDGEDDVLIGGPWTGGSQGAVALEKGPFVSGSLADAPLVVVGSGAYAYTAYAGFAVALVDLDEDGLDDVAMGEPGGAYYGGDGAIQVVSGLSTGAPTAFDATIDGEGDYDGVGYAMVPADVDGDGVEELITGAPYYPWGAMNGAVYVIPGGTTGSVEVVDVASTRLASSDAGDAAGWTVAAGDLDGDGADDLVAGAPYRGSWTGGVYIATEVEAGFGDLGDAVWLGGWGDGAGTGLAVGDFDGDGKGDLAISAPGTNSSYVDGKVYLFFGEPADGLVTDAAALVLGGSGEALGGALLAVDADADGTDELLAGGPTDTIEENTDSHAWLLQPPASGAAYRSDVTLSSFAGAATGDLTGYALGAADVSGDGAMDLLFAAPKDETAGEDAGAVFVVDGAL